MRLEDLRILVTGMGGQVGFEVAKALSPICRNLYFSARKANSRWNVLGTNFVEMDMEDEAAMQGVLKMLRPQIIINAAAYTQVDKAEEDEGRAFQINHRALEIFVEHLKPEKGAIVHFSTDYVFNTDHNHPIAEGEIKTPASVYGRSKLAGESVLNEANIPYIILRTSWVYGENGNNFVKTMLRLGKERSQLKIVNDQIGSPTCVSTLASTVVSILSQGRDETISFLADRSGDYNISDRGYTSWFHFAEMIFENARHLGYEIKVDQLLPISSAAYPTKAKRPLNSRMSLQKIEKTFGIVPPTWNQSLGFFLLQMQSQSQGL